MARLSLVPRDVRFFDQFELAAANLVEMARTVRDLLYNYHYEDLPIKLERIHELEHVGDTYTHNVMRALNQTFITPLDHEDIAQLIHSLDDVADQMWAAAVRLDIYQIRETTDTARRLADVLVQQTQTLAEAMPLLRHKSTMQRVLPVTVEVNRLENEADTLLRQGLRSLFSNPGSVQALALGIKWREIYDFLAEATDRAEDVANVMEGIVLKHG
jgi:predicted phosphate transport protein (TIGR00153 family)